MTENISKMMRIVLAISVFSAVMSIAVKWSQCGRFIFICKSFCVFSRKDFILSTLSDYCIHLKSM